jgi:hypothetical protein
MKSSAFRIFFGKNNNHLKKCASIVFLSFLSISCHKEKEDFQIDGVTGFTWKVYAVQEVNDNYINPIPTDWELNLKNDRTFSFKLGSSVCGGAYSWTTIDTASAFVKFTIGEWKNPAQSSNVADKLKNVIQSVDKCYSYKYPFLGQYPGPPPFAAMALQFQGSEGFFYVYR